MQDLANNDPYGNNVCVENQNRHDISDWRPDQTSTTIIISSHIISSYCLAKVVNSKHPIMTYIAIWLWSIIYIIIQQKNNDNNIIN